jgi:hypothetical protein
MPIDIWMDMEDIRPGVVRLGWVPSIKKRMDKENNKVIFSIFKCVFTIAIK